MQITASFLPVTIKGFEYEVPIRHNLRVRRMSCSAIKSFVQELLNELSQQHVTKLLMSMLQPVQENKYKADPTTLEIMGICPPAKVYLPAPAARSCTEKYLDFFRQEGNGFLVYDSQAAVVTRPNSCNFAKPEAVQRPVCNFKEHPTRYMRDQYKFGRLESVAPQKVQKTKYTLVVPQYNTLRFDAQFESGNLRKAVKVTDELYELSLECDTNTNGYTHWFYFKVTPDRQDHAVTFRIINLLRPGPLYNRGFKPLVKVHEHWTSDVQHVKYSTNESAKNTPVSYTLSFQYTFGSADAPVYFAYCYPYTYTEMMADVQALADNYSPILRVNTLCTSLAGNPVPVLTITHNVNSYTSWAKEQALLKKSAAGRRLARSRGRHRVSNPEKKAVVLSARVHPGETVGSHMLQGALKFLLGKSKEASTLRKHFVFKIVPMLNPDGVVWGNSRCSLLGIDLNRRWKYPHAKLHPVIHHFKRLVKLVAEEREVVAYCDMHGHSLKRGAFTYGCAVQSYSFEQMQRNLLTKLIPYLMYRKNEVFNYNECRFRMESSKEHTARIVLYKEAGITNSYTLESTFYSSQDKLEQLSVQQFGAVGADFLRVLQVFCHYSTFRLRMREMWEFCRQQLYEQAKAPTQVLRAPRPSPLPEPGDEEDSGPCLGDLDFSEFVKDAEFQQLCAVEDEESGGSDSNPSDEEALPKKSVPVQHLLRGPTRNTLRRRPIIQRPKHQIVPEKPVTVPPAGSETPKGASLKPRTSQKEPEDPLPFKFKKLKLLSTISPHSHTPSRAVQHAEPTNASGPIIYQSSTPNQTREAIAITPITQRTIVSGVGLQEVQIKPPRMQLASISGSFRQGSWVQPPRWTPKQSFLIAKLRAPTKAKRAQTRQEERQILGSLIKLSTLAEHRLT